MLPWTGSLVPLALLAAAGPVPDHFGRPLLVIPDLQDPAGVAWGADGRLFVVERGAHRVRVLAPDGKSERAFGARGSGTGELLRPAGIAWADGLVLVADTGNHRVVVFTAAQAPEAIGTWVRSFGTRGAGPGELFEPHGLALSAEQVFVADSGNDRVAVFSREGTFVRNIGGHGSAPGQLLAPLGCALDRRGSLYVTDALNHRVQRLSAEGAPLHTTGSLGPHPGLFDEPAGVACHEGLLYVADRLNHRIQVLDLAGNVSSIWGEPAFEPGNSVGRLFAPTAIAISADGERAAVVEPLLGRVQVFGRTVGADVHVETGVAATESLVRFGPRGGGDGGLLALIDPEQRTVIVSDVREVGPVRITVIGATGGPAQRLRAPLDCAVDAGRARVLVLDGGEPRLLAYDLKRDPAAPAAFDARMGRLERELDLRALFRESQARGVERAPAPRVIACDARAIYVVDAANSAVVVLDAALSLTSVWRGPGAPVDVAVGPGQRVYVLDADQRAVHAFEKDGRLVETWKLALERDRPDPVSIAWVGERALLNLGGGELAFFDRSGARGATLTAQVASGADFAAPGEVLPVGDYLYLIETGRRRGQVLDSIGRFLTMFGDAH